MANSRIMLVCKHCGGEFYIGKGYFGSYSSQNQNIHHDLNAFYDAHAHGLCSDDTDCSDNARNHFVILEEGETLADVVPKSEVEALEKEVINKAKSEALYDLKRQIHDKAVYPNNSGIAPYVSLKVFDAILQGYLNKYDDHRR